MTQVIPLPTGAAPGGDTSPTGGASTPWRRFVATLPMRAALIAVGVVWLLGCAWSFQEQSAFAASKGFAFPHLLPLVIDGFAVSMAGVSWAASLDARPAIPARLATVLAVGASSASNGVWAYLRTHHDLVTVVLGVAVPVAATLAFEVLLAELRRQVQRRRGLPPPVAVPYPRLIRLVLAPVSTFRSWRVLVLDLTAMDQALGPVADREAAQVGEEASAQAAGTATARQFAPAIELSEPIEREGTAPVVEPGEVDGDTDGLAERARVLVAGSGEPMGRRRLARELAVSEHTARRLLAQIDTDRIDTAGTDRDRPEQHQEQERERGLFALSGMGDPR